MKKSVLLFAIVITLSFGAAVADQPASRVAFRTTVVQEARGDEPRGVRDPIDRVIRLLRRVFRTWTNGDGMTPPKP